MPTSIGFRVCAVFVLAAAAACGSVTAVGVTVPPPLVDELLATKPRAAVAVVAGGCFWGVQAVFQHVKGVTRATSGYTGGTADQADYGTVSGGGTAHAESVEVTYDASVITYGQLLRVFFAVAHDPTQLNRQGPDSGAQYRSAIFTASPDQARVARAYIQQLDDIGLFGKPIVTNVSALTEFFAAEAYHQDYATNHPGDLYIRINDAPKLDKLRQALPDLYVTKKAPY